MNNLVFSITILLIFIFAFLNGLADSGIIVSTLISNRILPLKISLLIASIGNFIGPLIFGMSIIRTLSTGLFDIKYIKKESLIIALFSAILFNFIIVKIGIPASSSHSLIGALVGSSLFFNGLKSINVSSLMLILLFLVLSPIIGWILSLVITRLTYFILKNSHPKVNKTLKILQIPSSIIIALSHGANDSQKSTALFVISLFLFGYLRKFQVSYWMVTLIAFIVSIGTFVGGKKIIKTLSGKIYKLKPINGFSAQLSSTIVLFFATIFGYPVSTTHIVSFAIVGSGSYENLKRVKWQTVSKIIIALFVNLPLSFSFSFLISYLFNSLIKIL